MFKWCNGCQLIHLWTEFSPDRSKPSGLSVYCLACQRRRFRDRYRRTGGETSRRYYWEHRDAIRARQNARNARLRTLRA